MAMKKNEQAIKLARELIDEKRYEFDSAWEDVMPTPEREDRYIEEHGLEAYGRWYLALNTDKPADVKGRYQYPIGDFERIHRSLIAFAERDAAQRDYKEIMNAADDLVDRIEDKGRLIEREGPGSGG